MSLLAGTPAPSTIRAASRGFVHPGYVAGRWYASGFRGTLANTTKATGTIYWTPHFIQQAITISDLGARVGTAVALGSFQLALYASDPSTKKPTGLPLAVTASLSTTTGAVVTADITGADVTIQPGLYWFGLQVDTVAGTGSVAIVGTGTSPLFNDTIGASTAALLDSATTSALFAITTAGQTFGTWPDVTSATFTETNSSNTQGPYVVFKVVAVVSD